MSTHAQKKDCKFCDKKGLLWWPLRYAAVPSDSPNALREVLPELSAPLGNGVTDIALERGRYAIRTLRKGYIYVLSDRQLTEEQKKWRNITRQVRHTKAPGQAFDADAEPDLSGWDAYAVLDGGFLYNFHPDAYPQPVPEFSCNRHVCGIDASLISIPNAAHVNRVYALFTPTLMTPRMLGRYQKNAEAYVKAGKLQSFSPKQWLAGQRAQKHTIQAAKLDSTLAELIMHKSPQASATTLGKALGSQLFPAIVDPYEGKKPDALGGYAGQLGFITHKLKDQEALGFALHDPIGITQELNNFRNDAVDTVRPWLQTVDPKTKASNEHKLKVLNAAQEVKEALIAGVVSNQEAFLSQHRQSSDAWLERQTTQARNLRLQGHRDDADAIDKKVAQSRATREANYQKALADAKAKGASQWQSYSKRMPGMLPFEQTLKSQTERADQLALTRQADHLKWLRSQQLLNALHAYDRHDVQNGVEFKGQIGLALLGANYSPAAFKVVEEWAQSERIDTSNLLLRAYSLNQQLLEKSVLASLGKAKQLAQQPQGSWGGALDLIQGAMKNAIDAFDKANAALETAQTGSAFHGSLASMGAVTYTLLGQALFKSGSPRQPSWMQQRYMALLCAPLGRLNSRIRLSELAHAGTTLPSAQRSEAQGTRRVREILQAEIARGGQGDFYKVRLAGLIGLLEGFGLILRASKEDKGTREWLELTGASLAVTSAAFETLAVGVEMVQNRHRSVTMTSRGASVSLGGIKLFAGALASFAGAIGAVYDAVDANRAKDKKRYLLMTALFSRSIAQGSLVIIGALIGYSFSGPLFEALARRATEQGRMGLSRGFGFAARGASWLVRPASGATVTRVAMLIRAAACLTWVSVGVTVLLFAFSDDALEDWCDKSVFRVKPEPSEGFGNEDRELEALYLAFQEIS